MEITSAPVLPIIRTEATRKCVFGMSVIKFLCDALRKALVSFSLIIVVIAVLLYYFEDPNPTEYDR